MSTLAYSASAPVLCSKLTCHSLFDRAINLAAPDGGLLTLHRYGAGLSPMGWLLNRASFDAVFRLLYSGASVLMTYNGLLDNGFVLHRKRALSLNVKTYDTLTSPLSVLRCCCLPTGLSGNLNHTVNNCQTGANSILYPGLNQWRRGKIPNRQRLIGFCPGLAPSGDDRLIGALAVLYSNKPMRDKLSERPLLDHSLLLTKLMTTVSSCYLKQANRGYFSLLLLHIIHSLARNKAKEKAITRLLQHGHTSGANTLLGLSIGMRWLEDINRGVALYA